MWDISVHRATKHRALISNKTSADPCYKLNNNYYIQLQDWCHILKIIFQKYLLNVVLKTFLLLVDRHSLRQTDLKANGA